MMGRIQIRLSATRLLLLACLCTVLFTVSARGQGAGWGSPPPAPSLFVPHACLDPTNGDLLILSNSWRHSNVHLRRFHPDGTADSGFALQRFESCCTINPSLVAMDAERNVYTLEQRSVRFGGELMGFFLYKHDPSGELDLDWGEREGATPLLSPLPPEEDYAGGALDDDEEEEEDGGLDRRSPSGEGGGFEAGETTLGVNAGGGRLEFAFRDPVDLIPRADGSLLVLDRALRYVYRIDPEGRTVTEFIGRQDYYPVRPQRLIQDAEGYLYLVDRYDYNHFDMDRQGTRGGVGVFRFSPEGEWEMGWGEYSGGINDPWRTTMDMGTLVIDGTGALIALGGDVADMNHGQVFVFDRATGMEIHRDSVQYRFSYDESFVGMLGGLESGFVLLEARDFAILVNYYTCEGVRQEQVRIDDLYFLE